MIVGVQTAGQAIAGETNGPGHCRVDKIRNRFYNGLCTRVHNLQIRQLTIHLPSTPVGMAEWKTQWVKSPPAHKGL
jgi:hypothetical protein